MRNEFSVDLPAGSPARLPRRRRPSWPYSHFTLIGAPCWTIWNTASSEASDRRSALVEERDALVVAAI